MNAIQIIEARLAQITQLDEGGHDDFNHGVCAMEAAAYIAGEKWSDHPQCVCPVIAAFMRSWNDALPNDKRTALLLPLITKTIGTRGSADLANRRATMATDWLIRVHTPAWLRLAGLTSHADALASLPEITDFAKTPSLMPVLEAARKDAAAARAAAGAAARAAAGAAARAAARAAAGAAAGAAARAAAGDAARAAAGDAAWAAAGDAAWAAAWAAARAAAWDAARAAAGDAAWAAAWAAAGAAARAAAWDAARAAAGAAAGDAAWAAAGDAAGDAARAAAWAAAGAAAGDAAREKLAATVTELQASAVDLVQRMCALGEVQS